MRNSLRPQKTSLLIAQRIVEEIRRLDKREGDHLPPEKVMLEQYGVGRGTLRESLRFLELQGLISIRPGPKGGPVIEPPNSSGLATSLTLLLQFERAPYRSIIEAREALEPSIASLAAQRLSDTQLKQLKINVASMIENVDNERTFLELNQDFHGIIATGSENELFCHLIGALTDIIDGSSVGIDYPAVRRLAIHRAHERILDALIARDSANAAEAMRIHIGEYSEYVQHRFPGLAKEPIAWITP